MRELLLLIPILPYVILFITPDLNELILIINYHPPNTFLIDQYRRRIDLSVANVTTTDDTACIVSTEGTLHCILDYSPEKYRKCDSAVGIQGYYFCAYPPGFTQVMPEVNLTQVWICSDWICGFDKDGHRFCVSKSAAHEGKVNGKVTSKLEVIC